jgi:hypothetical protein
LPRSPAATILAAFLGLAASSMVRGEDLTIVFKVVEKGGEHAATHYFSATRARFDQGDHGTIVDLAAGRILSVSWRKKHYSETTFAEIELALTSRSAQMEKAMAGLPEGLRDKMTGEEAKEVTFTRGPVRTIAGVSCQTYTVALGEKNRMEACVTIAIPLPFDAKSFSRLALAEAPVAPASYALNRMVQKMRTVEGISLASSTSFSMFGQTIATTMEATEIRKGPIDASTFDLPPDFKKVDSPWH